MLRTGQICLLLSILSFTASAADVAVQLSAGDGFVVKDNTGVIEWLRIDEATGNISRGGALFVHTTGDGSTFVGEGAGNLATSGVRNSAFGLDTLSANTTGKLNAAFGERALNANLTGSYNAAFGGATHGERQRRGAG